MIPRFLGAHAVVGDAAAKSSTCEKIAEPAPHWCPKPSMMMMMMMMMMILLLA